MAYDITVSETDNKIYHTFTQFRAFSTQRSGITRFQFPMFLCSNSFFIYDKKKSQNCYIRDNDFSFLTSKSTYNCVPINTFYKLQLKIAIYCSIENV